MKVPAKRHFQSINYPFVKDLLRLRIVSLILTIRPHRIPLSGVAPEVCLSI